MLKNLLILFLLVGGSMQAQGLKDYIWENRLIILFPDEGDNAFDRQKKLLLSRQKDLEERDIVLLKANESIKTQLNQDSDFHGILLIGKDGGIKLKAPFVVQPDVIFTLIDGMPMRRSEMNKKKKY